MASVETFLSLGRENKRQLFRQFSTQFGFPTCPALESQWIRMFEKQLPRSRGIVKLDDFAIASVANLPVRCLGDWVGFPDVDVVPVAIFNPLQSRKVTERFGETNVVFEYDSVMYAGVLGEQQVFCVRPLVEWKQTDIRHHFQALVGNI